MKINYGTYVEELTNRFNNMAHLVTEDLIRQLFIETQKFTIRNTIIEKPYRELLSMLSRYYSEINSRARADFYYNGKNEDVVIEFKYHKKVDRSTTCKTTNMGEVFRDLNRLSILENKEKYFIYVFDQEMKDYYDSQPFDILKIGKNNTATIPASMSDYIKDEHGEFYKNAFSSFSDMFQDFSGFSYTVDVLYSSRIITYKKLDGKHDNIYLIILSVN